MTRGNGTKRKADRARLTKAARKRVETDLKVSSVSPAWRRRQLTASFLDAFRSGGAKGG